MIKNEFDFLKTGKAQYSGFSQKVVDFINEMQVKDRRLWEKFVDAFGTGVDAGDKGWRGEYFGKMMRGACLVYSYTGDKELYDTLLFAVKGILSKQEKSGRISTYDIPNEFTGWDMWARKYVMVGLEYFYDICDDEEFKKSILNALVSHADYIVERVGQKENQKPIKKTSEVYGALNSCSILDAFLQLYKLTGNEKYVGFAEYIISSCDDLVKCVKDGKLKICEFPQTKAYELMSFFEGLLTYYECTGKKFYLDTVIKFFEDLQKTEQTIIGGMGTMHEYFDDSTLHQTEYSGTPMLETCVTVTWIRVLTRLLMLTGDVKYADRIEIAACNALYGTINFEKLPQFCPEKETMVEGLPFDSYSPLVASKRGIAIGGFKELADGTHYGCCACIGAAAVALFPLCAVLSHGNGIVVNYCLNGKASVILPNGNNITVEMNSDYPKSGEAVIRFIPDTEDEFSVKLRIPEWAESATYSANGKTYRVDSGYLSFENVSEYTEIKLNFPLVVKSCELNGKTAFTRGPIVLARDEEKENRKIDFDKTEILECDTDGSYKIENIPALDDENYRCRLKTVDGDGIILSDYATCGKKWTNELARICVWLNLKKYNE